MSSEDVSPQNLEKQKEEFMKSEHRVLSDEMFRDEPRYLVHVSHIGQGAGGVVYECWDNKLGRKVAAKIPPPKETNPNASLNIEVEAKTLAKLRHPNVVEVYDTAVDTDGRIVILMEYLKGDTLEKAIFEGKLKLQQVGNILKGVASGVDYIDGRGIRHRDIKPNNVILTEDGPKIIDFGIAITKGTFSGENLVGTLSYMSPEEVNREDTDIRSDVFTLGTMAYEVITRKEDRFPGRSVIEIAQNIAAAAPLSPEQENEVIKALEGTGANRKEVINSLNKGQHKEKTERYANCTEFAVALDQALNPSAL